MTIEGVHPLGILEYTTVYNSLEMHIIGLPSDSLGTSYFILKNIFFKVFFLCVWQYFLYGVSLLSVVKQFKKGNQWISAKFVYKLKWTNPSYIPSLPRPQ